MGKRSHGLREIIPVTYSNDFPNVSALVVVFVRFVRSVFHLPEGVFGRVNQAEPMGRRFDHRFIFKALVIVRCRRLDYF